MEGRPTPAHVYHSTGCYHDYHDHCRSDRALSGAPKEPHSCKFCAEACICPCHQGMDVSTITPAQLHTLSLTATIKTHVGSYDEVDFDALKTIMTTLDDILRYAGNPWGSNPAPIRISETLDHAINVVQSLRDLQ